MLPSGNIMGKNEVKQANIPDRELSDFLRRKKPGYSRSGTAQDFNAVPILIPVAAD